MNPPSLHPAASLLCVGFDGLEPTPFLVEALAKGVSVVILFARNVGDPELSTRTCSLIREAAGRPIVIAVDQEGGTSRRLVDGFSSIPAMRELSVGGPEAVADAARTTARELRSVGIDLDLAPVVDVDSNPDNPVIGDRSFSSDPDRAARLGAAWIRAMQSESVAACAKHFPGHGDTSLDSHHELPHVGHDLARLRSVELPPFTAAIDCGVAAIMSAHVVYRALDPDLPATLSRTVLHDLLRTELGFDGLLISDDLEMEAIASLMPVEAAGLRAVEAGIDLLLCCHREDRQRALLGALLEAGPTPRLDTAIGRVGEFLARYAR